MDLTFLRSEVEQLIEHSKKSPAWESLYKQPETAKPGLWLVGDNGIYLRSNGNPRFNKPYEIEGEDGSFVAYAQECDPSKLPFDEWWANKQESFGGDDEIDYIPSEEVDIWLDGTKGSFLVMESDPTGFQLMGGRTRYLPGSLRAAMGDRRYYLRLQKAQVTEVDGRPISQYDRSMLLVFIGCIRATGRFPWYDKIHQADWTNSADKLMYHQIPVPDLQEDDLKVMLITQLEENLNEPKPRVPGHKIGGR
jgi:Protein of unknown function (DUF3085)